MLSTKTTNEFMVLFKNSGYVHGEERLLANRADRDVSEGLLQMSF